jgi:hypothetical protein
MSFCAVKNFTSRRHFLVTYFLLLKKSNWLEGIRVKNHHGRWREACFCGTAAAFALPSHLCSPIIFDIYWL